MTQTHLCRFITVALYTAVFAGTWDAWWHGAIGRDTFWIPPHLLLYTATLTAIGVGLYGWLKSRDKYWRRLALVLVLVPLAAPFDELWHRLFGKESLASPLIVWSPPHLLLIGAIAAAFILLLPCIKQDRDENAVRIFGALPFAAMIALVAFLVSPLEPFGPFSLIGFYGAGAGVLLWVMLLLSGRWWLPGLAGATLIVTVFIVLDAISFGHLQLVSNLPPHPHPPGWLIIFAFLIPAMLADLWKRAPLPTLGALMGLIQSGIIYGFAKYFFESQFFYTPIEAAQAITASIVGGFVAGFIVDKILKKD